MQKTIEVPLEQAQPLAVFNAKIYEKPARKMLLWSIVGFAVSVGAKFLAQGLARKLQTYNRAKTAPLNE